MKNKFVAEWTGKYPNLCYGEWILKYNNITIIFDEDDERRCKTMTKKDLLNHRVTVYTMGGHRFHGLFVSCDEGTMKIIDAWYNTMYIDESRVEAISVSAD